MLVNLESLDVSTNCISRFSSFSSLVRLHHLVSVSKGSNLIIIIRKEKGLESLLLSMLYLLRGTGKKTIRLLNRERANKA